MLRDDRSRGPTDNITLSRFNDTVCMCMFGCIESN